MNDSHYHSSVICNLEVAYRISGDYLPAFVEIHIVHINILYIAPIFAFCAYLHVILAFLFSWRPIQQFKPYIIKRVGSGGSVNKLGVCLFNPDGCSQHQQ